MLKFLEKNIEKINVALLDRDWSSTNSIAGVGLFTAAICWYTFRKMKGSVSPEPPDGKCVLVTGCDSGFGNLLTHRLLDAGYTVVAACYTKDGAARLNEMQSKKINAIVADLSTKEGRKKVVDATSDTCKKMGGLYAIVNNAGVALPGNVAWLKPKIYEDSMNLNFHAPVELTYGLLPLIKKKKGRVINVTSVCGMVPSPTNSAYSASKHALESWSDCLRCEMLEWDVKVVIIQPSTMKTPLVMAFADKYRDIFLAADTKRKSLYGDDEWIKAVHKDLAKGLEDMSEDPMVTANDLVQALHLKNPPARIKSGVAAKIFFHPLSWLPDKVRDNILYALMFKKEFTPQSVLVPYPPPNKISHVSIKVTDLTKAVDFYRKMGFRVVGNAQDGKQFMKGGGHKLWKPLLLLVEDPNMSPRQKCYDIGQTRLCLYSTNLKKDVEVLKSKGLEVSYPITEIGMAKIATYKDPDSFVVYIIQFKYAIGLICRLVKFINKIEELSTFHWTINVGDSAKVNKMFEQIGFNPMSDQNKDQVGVGLLPAFGLESETTVVEHIRLAHLPNDNFVLTTMEWVEPKSSMNGQELCNSLSIAVENVDEAIQKAKDAGMIVKEGAIQNVRLPYYGEVEIGTVYLEEGSNPIEFVAY